MVKFPDEENKLIESVGESNVLVPNDHPWDECPSDEENNNGFEYKYEEDE